MPCNPEEFKIFSNVDYQIDLAVGNVYCDKCERHEFYVEPPDSMPICCGQRMRWCPGIWVYD